MNVITKSILDESYPDTKTICDTLDLIHIMAYDFHGGWEDVIGHHSPFISDGRHPSDPDNKLTVKVGYHGQPSSDKNSSNKLDGPLKPGKGFDGLLD